MNLNYLSLRRGARAGISMAEILLVVAVFAILASGIRFVWKGVSDGTGESQLRSHVRMLNSSIDIYRASGGDLSGITDPQAVLTKLKTVASQAVSRKINGYRGATVDVRLRGVSQTATEAAGSGLRAVWLPAKMKFELADSGPIGFKRFVTDLPAVDPQEEARNTAVELASTGGWIWDYDEFDEQGGGPSLVSHGTPWEEVEDPADPRGDVLTLNPPEFSIPGGSYEYGNFDLPLSFENTNPVGVSEVYYSVDGSGWVLYSGGEISVPAGAAVSAYSVSIDPDNWTDSIPSSELYESTFVITGSTAGLFSNPVGGPNMVTGGWGNYFTWGTPATWAGYTDPSWILYEGASFFDVLPGERFMLGSIEYYNGTIAGGTGATGLDLSITLSFAGGAEDELFEYDLNLINSPNLQGNTQEQSADYVQFGEIASEVPATLGGVEYTLVLEFGETSENGFSTIDEFFVFEGESATGELYGTLIPAWGGEAP